MKALHRTKTLAAYEGARIVLKSEMNYPAYMLLKEAARGLLSYIVEDQMDQDISDKTKLSRLIELIDVEKMDKADLNAFNTLIEAENNGLAAIISMDTSELKLVKHTIKKLIAEYMREPI